MNSKHKRVLVIFYFFLTLLASPNHIFFDVSTFDFQSSLASFLIGFFILCAFMYAYECTFKQYYRYITPWTGLISLFHLYKIINAPVHELTKCFPLSCFWGIILLISAYLFFANTNEIIYTKKRPKHIDVLFYSSLFGVITLLISTYSLHLDYNDILLPFLIFPSLLELLGFYFLMKGVSLGRYIVMLTLFSRLVIQFYIQYCDASISIITTFIVAFISIFLNGAILISLFNKGVGVYFKCSKKSKLIFFSGKYEA